MAAGGSADGVSLSDSPGRVCLISPLLLGRCPGADSPPPAPFPPARACPRADSASRVQQKPIWVMMFLRQYTPAPLGGRRQIKTRNKDNPTRKHGKDQVREVVRQDTDPWKEWVRTALRQVLETEMEEALEAAKRGARHTRLCLWVQENVEETLSFYRPFCSLRSLPCRPLRGASRQACHAGGRAGRVTQSRTLRESQSPSAAKTGGVARRTARSTSTRRRPPWSKPPGLPCRRSRRQSHTIPSCAGVPTPSGPHACALHLNPPRRVGAAHRVRPLFSTSVSSVSSVVCFSPCSPCPPWFVFLRVLRVLCTTSP